jgi:hypothetical protein
MPATFDNSEEVVSMLPSDKVYILDGFKPDLAKYPVIYQDFGAVFMIRCLKAMTFLLNTTNLL